MTSEKRSDLLPELPTMIESGVKDYVVEHLDGLRRPGRHARAGGRQAQCRAEPHRQLPPVREKMLAQGIECLPPGPPAAAQKLVRDDLDLWLPIIKASGASAE